MKRKLVLVLFYITGGYLEEYLGLSETILMEIFLQK